MTLTSLSPKSAKKLKKGPVIMQIIPALGAGGAEQGCIDVAAGLVQAGATSIIVSNGGPRTHDLARSGAMHIKLPVHSKNPFIMWKNIGAIRKLIRMHNVDVVHVRSRAPAWSAWRACRGTGAHFMTTCHAPYNTENGVKNFYNSSISKGERVIAISDFVAQYLRDSFGLDDKTIRIVHNGIALEKFHPTMVTPERMIKISRQWRLPDGASVIMMPGRLTRWKGHHVLIEAMALLGRADVFCAIIGSTQGKDEYRQELEAAILARGLEGRVRIIDHCDDMPSAYMLSTIVVSASTDPEGFGRVPVEAQAMGRPVIATDHGGAQETIRRGETGWLITPNDPNALARAMGEALSLTQQQRAILATHAMAHVAEHFTRERMIEQTLDIYAELMDAESRTFKPKAEAPVARSAAAE